MATATLPSDKTPSRRLVASELLSYKKKPKHFHPLQQTEAETDHIRDTAGRFIKIRRRVKKTDSSTEF